MGVQVVWTGLQELRRALRDLPQELTDEAQDIVQARAERVAQDTKTSYPERTGNLTRGVRISRRQGGRFGARVEVRSTAPHSHMYEQGTKRRSTRAGANRGVMPAANILIPIAIRQRRAMYEDLIAVVRRAGFRVDL